MFVCVAVNQIKHEYITPVCLFTIWLMLSSRVLYWIAPQEIKHCPYSISNALLATVLYQDKTFKATRLLVIKYSVNSCLPSPVAGLELLTV